MAYTKATRNRSTITPRTGSKSANVQLSIATPDGDYLCESSKGYTDKASVIQELDNNDAFITLSSFSKNLAALTVHNAKALVIKNVGITALEISLRHPDWRDDSGGTDTDVVNSVDMNEENSTGEETFYRWVSTLLPVGEFMYLPTSRVIGYSPLNASSDLVHESATNAVPGAVAIEPKEIDNGAEIIPIHLFASQTYGSGADLQVTEDVAIDETAIDVDDGDWFEVGDLIAIGTEIMEVESISTNTLNVKRGLLGSVQAAHSDDDDLNFFIGNEYLAFDNGKCQTDQNGKFSQRGAFFYYGRSADKKTKGIVPGSVAILRGYTEGGYLDWGLQNIKASDKTGLVAGQTYTFHLICDEYNVGGIDSVSTETAIAFTVDASDTTWAGSGNAVLPTIQAVLDEQFYTTSSGLANKKVTIGLHNGDVRVTSHSNHSETRVGIANVSGTTPFGVGRFPALSGDNVPVLLGSEHGGGSTDDIVFGPASSLPQETIEDPVTGKEVQNTDAFLIDDGNGNLTHNGTVVGSISYSKGHCQWTDLPSSEFKIYAQSLSAHAGGVSYVNNAQNSIQEIKARSVNAKQDGKVELLLLG
tara:strand:- start:1632 stop:3392 length:1761 start_codon:yes stop_codon:yes gene_type:complete